MAEAVGRREGKGWKENPSAVEKAERLKEGATGNRRKAPMSVAGREYDCERRTICLCRASASGSSRRFSYSRKGGSTREQRG